MRYKNIVLIITTVVVAIATAIIAATYYKWKPLDYSYLSEYDMTDGIDISEDVKIENIDYLYYITEGKGYFTDEGWRYSEFNVRSLRGERFYGKKDLIFSYDGKKLTFDYEIVAVDGALKAEDVSADRSIKFRIVPKDKNVSGTLDFELPTRDALSNQYVLKSVPIVLVITLSIDLIIAIIFAIIDYKEYEGIFYWVDLPSIDFSMGRSYSTTYSHSVSSSTSDSLGSSASSSRQVSIASNQYKIERIKKYEEKYDLTKEENAVFKELAYDTLGRLFIKSSDDSGEDQNSSDNTDDNKTNVDVLSPYSEENDSGDGHEDRNDSDSANEEKSDFDNASEAENDLKNDANDQNDSDEKKEDRRVLDVTEDDKMYAYALSVFGLNQNDLDNVNEDKD